jgi:SHS2 domain-containing protein
MGQVETFEHTADLGLRIEAESLEDLFETAAVGLFQMIVANLDQVRPLEQREVVLESDTTAELLVIWLNELIFESETRHVVYSRFQVRLEEDGLRLRAIIAGEAIDPSRHVLDHEVKAVTRHGLKLEGRGEGWLAEVIVDI